MKLVRTDKEILRRALCRDYLDLDVTDDYNTRIFAEVDSFVALSQGNTSINYVSLHPYDVDPGNYELWDKVGQGVGNLKSLGVVSIYLRDRLRDWEILARILPHIQNKIELRINSLRMQGTEEMLAFARAIQQHPAITRIDTAVSFENTATLCSALNTLPNLEYATIAPLVGPLVFATSAESEESVPHTTAFDVTFLNSMAVGVVAVIALVKESLSASARQNCNKAGVERGRERLRILMRTPTT
jgi:hypothetical protein